MRLKFMLMLHLVTTSAFAEETSQACWETAMTQGAMNDCAQRDLDRSDAELNRLYRELQVRYKDDPAFIQRLQAAQSAWIKFRDAQLEMKFPPHAHDPYHYGSVLPMCSMLYLQELTSNRIATLKEWLTGSNEGDVCSGSLKSQGELRKSKAPLHNGGSRHR